MSGRPLGVVPHGVAARESLRTEAGYLLNGNDMDAQTNPFEAGLEWVVKLSKDFIGRDALARIKSNGVARKLVGLEVQGPHTVRNGYPIMRNGREVGQVTSGPLSAGIAGRNLGLGYVSSEHARVGTELEIEIRGRKAGARIVPIPFAPRRVKDEPTVSTYSPYHLRYNESHVWARVDDGAAGNVVTIGVSDFCQRSLGDILCVDLPKVGHQVARGASLGWCDSYRKPYEIVAPVAGVVVEVNETLMQHPARINAYPYAREGLLKLRAGTPGEFESLMRFEDYAELVRRLRCYDEWSRDRRVT